jgi:nicotinate-nucleotide pyrophosphorylase (carboxylating)
MDHLLVPSTVRQLVQEWLKEDIPSMDYGGYVVGSKPEKALLYCKADGILAGVPFVNEVFRGLACQVEWKYEEGAFLQPNGGRVVVAEVTGPACALLQVCTSIHPYG